MLNFFDFGSHEGQEIDYLITNLKDQNIDYTIYSFEANPDLYLKLKEKYKDYNNINLYNLAISSINGKIKLYKCTTSDHCGSSIYKDKRNVLENDFYEVISTKFSDWLLDNNIVLITNINIIKANIEGAEIDLFNDLEKNNLIQYFQLFLCSHKQGFSRDMRKITSLIPKAHELDQLMKRNNIKQHIFTLAGKGSKYSIDLIHEIKTLYKDIKD